MGHMVMKTGGKDKKSEGPGHTSLCFNRLLKNDFGVFASEAKQSRR
jgi:hypothetical protein